ncbi:MAG TPA: DUF1552 domain-containing protein, partial [Tepidisphaeraceae bacterium]|nr:DUF1552 domain-containing protein [Tepidisphaeraceae bacterium]
MTHDAVPHLAVPTLAPRRARNLSRRDLLRAAGVAMALPALELFQTKAFADGNAEPVRRMVCVCAPLGLHPKSFFPEGAGADYAPSPYLEPLKELRNDFSVISGLAHPDVGSTHDSIASYLTAAPHPELRAGFRNTISLDQFAAEHVGLRTRYASLSLSSEGSGLSWTRSGAMVPSDLYPASVFARLFLDGKPDEVREQVARLRDGRSILDTVGQQAKSMGGAMGRRDRHKVDEYFTSVRELEKRMVVSEQWASKPKPKVDARPPQNNTNSADMIGKARLMFDLVHLALQTDSTRLVTMLLLGTSLVPPVTGVTQGHHDLSHHGQEPTKIAQLQKIELELMGTVRELLTKLKGTTEAGATLLDRTTVLFGSNLGNASNHSTRNLPVLLAGG